MVIFFSPLSSLHAGLMKNAFEGALMLEESLDRPLTVRLDPVDISPEGTPQTSPTAAADTGIPLSRPAPLTEDFYDEDSEEDQVRKCDLPMASSFASSMGALSDNSVLADSLGYSVAASSSCAGSTMRTATLGLSGNGSLMGSYGRDTVDALREALDSVQVRTPTP